MKRVNITLLMTCLLLLSACGGGSTNSAVGPGGTLLDTSSNECQNSYYKQLAGTYKGVVTYLVESERIVQSCEWDAEIRLTTVQWPGQCNVEGYVDLEVRQLVVYDGIDNRAYQCIGEQRSKRISEPFNSENDDAVFESVRFPVEIDINGGLIDGSGPYFGDTSTIVLWYPLFSSPRNVVQRVEVNEDDTMSLFVVGGTGQIESLLTKEE